MMNLTIQINYINLRGQVERCGKWKCMHRHVFIHPASLCLSVGAFNSLTFKVIIDIYDSIHNKLWKILKDMGIPLEKPICRSESNS